MSTVLRLTMDKDGKINGKTPVFNDVLAFVYSKAKSSDVRTLVEVIADFYSLEDLREARDLLYFLIDPNGHLPRLPKKSNIACGVALQVLDKYEDLNWIFLALYLNHIPQMDRKKEEDSSISNEQHEVQ